MSIEMSIARTAMSMNEMKLQQAVNVEMLKKTMELQELEAATLIDKLSNVPSPTGNILDTRA